MTWDSSTFTTKLRASSLVMMAAAGVASFPADALAANPEFFTSRVTFEARLSQSINDGYDNPGYVFIQNDAAMSAVLGETTYMSTGFLNHNIVSGATYCAGCNGSFQLGFLSTTFSSAQGTEGVGLDIRGNDSSLPYHAFITYGDATTQDVLLPNGASFFGVLVPERVSNIRFGLVNGGTTQSGSFQIDNLIVGTPCSGASCDDGNPCTVDSCNAANGGCFNVAGNNGASCSDLSLCTQGDACQGGSCVGAPVDCNDGNQCTDDSCIAGQGCLNPASAPGSSCDDGVNCTESDACTGAGSCAGVAVVCDDANGCTTEACNEALGCVAVAIDDGTVCDDGSSCTGDGTCTAGECVGALTCSDGNPCSVESCEDDECSTPVPADPGTACDDDDVCTLRDTCDAAGECTGGSPLDCDDDNDCTLDGCQSSIGCLSVAAPDGAACEGGTCDGGTCAPDGSSSVGSGGAPGSGGAAGTGGDDPSGTGGDAAGSGGDGPSGGPSSSTTGTSGSTGSGTGGSSSAGPAGSGGEDGGEDGGDAAAGDEGCGCTVVGSPIDTRAGLVAFVVLAGAMARRRRSRRDASR